MVAHVTLICRDEPYPPIQGDVIGVDAGAAYALRHHLNLVLAIGDFDSIDATTLNALRARTNIETHPTDKDLPDSALAIEAALKRGYTELTLYGGLGGRIDHQHANIVLCSRYPQLTLVDDVHVVKAYPRGEYTLIDAGYAYFSVFSFEKATLSLNGCAYPLDHYELHPSDILGLSNRFFLRSVHLSVHDGTVVVMLTKAEKNGV